MVNKFSFICCPVRMFRVEAGQSASTQVGIPLKISVDNNRFQVNVYY